VQTPAQDVGESVALASHACIVPSGSQMPTGTGPPSAPRPSQYQHAGSTHVPQVPPPAIGSSAQYEVVPFIE
jgi:hypothetical protein